MHFNIVYPYDHQQIISGSSYNSAIKNYIKSINNINLTNLIIQNDNLYRQTYINYMNRHGKKIAKIRSIPLNSQYPLSYYIDRPFDLPPPPLQPNMGVMRPVVMTPPVYVSPYMAF